MADHHANEIQQKRRTLRGLYGGMMSLEQLKEELGYRSPKSARAWLAEVGLAGTRIGKSIKYDTDQVAKILVDARGMC